MGQGSIIAAVDARHHTPRLDRFELRPLLEPLFQQQRSGGTVETATSVAVQTVAFGSGPGAALLIHPGQRQVEGRCEAQAVAMAMLRLRRRRPLGIQRQAHHEALNGAPGAMVPQYGEVGIEA